MGTEVLVADSGFMLRCDHFALSLWRRDTDLLMTVHRQRETIRATRWTPGSLGTVRLPCEATRRDPYVLYSDTGWQVAARAMPSVCLNTRTVYLRGYSRQYDHRIAVCAGGAPAMEAVAKVLTSYMGWLEDQKA